MGESCQYKSGTGDVSAGEAFLRSSPNQPCVVRLYWKTLKCVQQAPVELLLEWEGGLHARRDRGVRLRRIEMIRFVVERFALWRLVLRPESDIDACCS